jgi:uncharacterized membrane protein YagU involved in acid resistance
MNSAMFIELAVSFSIFFGFSYCLNQRSGNKVALKKVLIESVLFALLFQITKLLLAKVGLF